MTEPSKPLTILTLDGGGLQATTTLLILNKVLEKIAEENGLSGREKPRPCDVFDTIAGIGTGGWLAILLGRFRMDVTSCLSEWFNLLQRIVPRSMTEEFRLRLLQHCHHDTDRLVEQVDSLVQVYGRGDRLFEPDPQDARTRHVLVAAPTSDGRSYKLFRSYEIPKSAKLPEKLLEGPENPDRFKISHAFGVTGAAKHFTSPWTEQMARSGKTRFSDTKFPEPHNITKLALDEMCGIYGTDVPLSVVVNIGPGLPDPVDVQRITSRFSGRIDPIAAHEASHTKRARPPIVPSPQSDSVKQDLSDHSHDNAAGQDPTTEPATKGEQNHSVARTNIFGSTKARAIADRLKRLEDDIVKDNKKKLNSMHPGNANLYYRLAPAGAPRGNPSDIAMDGTLSYLNDPVVDATIDNLVKRIPKFASN